MLAVSRARGQRATATAPKHSGVSHVPHHTSYAASRITLWTTEPPEPCPGSGAQEFLLKSAPGFLVHMLQQTVYVHPAIRRGEAYQGTMLRPHDIG